MRAIPPLSVTDAVLTSSSVPDGGVAAWSGATTYGLGDQVRLTTGTVSDVYTSLSGGNLNHSPDVSPSWWAPAGIYYTAWSAGAVYGLGDVVRVASTDSHLEYESLSAGDGQVVTLTIASPCVVSRTAHGWANGTEVLLTTTGALPTGLAASTVYYVISATADAFQLAATPGGAAINTSGSQSGVHTAVAGPNKNKAPAGNPSFWVEIGATNRWKMFDLLRNTGTTVPSPLTVVLTPGRRFDSIALLGLDADEVEITVVAAAVTIYSATIDLQTREVVSWYGYYITPFAFKRSVVLIDIPPLTGAVITVTISKASGNVTCGSLALGTSVYVGITVPGAENDALNFSKIERDEFGNSLLIPRRSVPRSTQTVIVEKANVKRVIDLRTDLNAVPAVWTGIDDQDSDYFEPLLILGVYKRFTLAMDDPPGAATGSIELEEV